MQFEMTIRSNLGQGCVYADHQLEALSEGADPVHSIARGNIQPASADIGIDPEGYTYLLRSMPPSVPNCSIADILQLNYGYDKYPNSSCPTLLKNNVYLVEMEGQINLRPGMCAYFSPKSTSGRLDLYCTIISDHAPGFDELAAEYRGKLYMIVVAQSFPVTIAPSQTFSQIRLYDRERKYVSGNDLQRIHEIFPLIEGSDPVFTDKGIMLHLDLSDTGKHVVADFNGNPIDVRKRAFYDSDDYFRSKRLTAGRSLELDDREFMLVVSKERVRMPSFLCGEMVAQHEARGPFRAHTAGFIDPGYGGEKGDWLTCEVRNIAPFQIQFRHGQRIALLRFERMRSLPSALYGKTSATEPSHYNKRVYPKQFK